MSLALLPLAFLGSVSAHGGVLWPPVWQAGVSTPIEELTSGEAFTEPKVRDPNSGVIVKSVKSWLTDQAYTGGVGDEFKGIGPVTNEWSKNKNEEIKNFDRCWGNCAKYRNPWAAPGQAPSLGGGCGVFGGNPLGCPAGKDTRPPGSVCGQDKPIGRGKRGTSSFGTDARLFDFPQMITTKWQVGSVQDVVWASSGGHRGGYTYRLCKLPREGRTAITEECFTKNVLEFATNFTMIKALNNAGEGTWEKFEQTDLRKGTFPEGSAWRPVGKYLKSKLTMRKDSVVVPASLKPGKYVLGWRWDSSGGNQVWVSCASMRLVRAPSGRAAEEEEEYEDEEYPSLYTDEEYEELEEAFESTRAEEDDDEDDFDGPLYTDEEYEELEEAFENY
jgi:hypothetical protein